jgi:hypothetical protein
MDVEKCVLGIVGINVCILGLTTGLAFGFMLHDCRFSLSLIIYRARLSLR